MGSAPVGHEDDPEAGAELAVGGLTERLFEAVGLSVGEMDADRGRAEFPSPVGVPPLYMNEIALVGLCMRTPVAIRQFGAGGRDEKAPGWPSRGRSPVSCPRW